MQIRKRDSAPFAGSRVFYWEIKRRKIKTATSHNVGVAIRRRLFSAFSGGVFDGVAWEGLGLAQLPAEDACLFDTKCTNSLRPHLPLHSGYDFLPYTVDTFLGA